MTDQEMIEAGDRVSEQKAQLEKLTESAKPLIKYLCDNHHPHVVAIVTPTGVELLEGILNNPNITEFIKD